MAKISQKTHKKTGRRPFTGILRTLGVMLLVMALVVSQIPPVDISAVSALESLDFHISGETLLEYVGSAQDITIPSHVTLISDSAFEGNPNIRTVRIGDQVTDIGYNAFYNCPNLTTVEIGDGVNRIGNSGFGRCTQLSNVSIGSGIQELGTGVFLGCPSLSYVDFKKPETGRPAFICDDGVIYDYAISTVYQVLGGRLSPEYATPESIIRIKPYAFWGADNVNTIGINHYIYEITGYSFSGAHNLKNVELPYSIRSIDMKAFEDCFAMTDIFIPKTVEFIHSTAFDGDYLLTIHSEPGSVAETFAANFSPSEINKAEYDAMMGIGVEEETGEDGITPEEGAIIAEAAKRGWSVTTERVTGNGVDAIIVSGGPTASQINDDRINATTKILSQGAYAAVNGDSTKVYDGTAYEEELSRQDAQTNAENAATQQEYFGDEGISTGHASSDKDFIPKFAFYNGRVARGAYYGSTGIDYVEFPETATAISDFAFARSSIKEAIIPNGVTSIGYGAFYNCEKLRNVSIPSTVSYIAPYAFDNTPWMKAWQAKNEEFLIVGDGILLKYGGNASYVTIPGNVKTIGPGAFYGNASLKEVDIPESVKIIGESSFAECASLKSVNGMAGVLKISDRAFENTPLKEFHIGSNVMFLGQGALNISSAPLPGSVLFVDEGVQPVIGNEATAMHLNNFDYRKPAISGFEKIVAGEEEYDSPEFLIGGKEPSSASAGSVTVIMDDEEFEICGDFPVDEEYSAKVRGLNRGVFYLSLLDPGDTSSIDTAYSKFFAGSIPENGVYFYPYMWDHDSGVQINTLNKQELSITVPIPHELRGYDLRVLSVDHDGQLERIPRSISADGTRITLEFSSTLEPCVMYTVGEQIVEPGALEKGGIAFREALAGTTGNLDDSPDTGDHSIPPKYILAVGLLFAGLALLLMAGGRRKTE